MICYELDVLTHLIFIAPYDIFINKYLPSDYNTSGTGLEQDRQEPCPN